MLQASRSLSRSLLVAAVLLPACALAAGQVDLSPPPIKSAVAVPVGAQALKAAKALAVKPAPAKAASKHDPLEPSQANHLRVIHPHALMTRAPKRVRPHEVHRVPRQPQQVPQPRLQARRRTSLPPGTIVVSTQGLNRFVFPAAVVKGPIFPADAPVLGTPVYLDDNRQVLVQFVPGADQPFEMVVELAGHQVKSFLLAPRNVPGVTYHARGVHPPHKHWNAASAGTGGGSSHHAELTLLRGVVMGEVPDAFYPTRLPPAVHFDKFNIVPRASWSDGSGHRILVYALVSVRGQAAVVAAPEFYHEGMAAILLSGAVVDATHSPLLYILEGAARG